MRTIKFKAKRVDTGAWVYGSLDVAYDGSCSIAYWVSKLIEPENNYHEMVQEWHQVIPETVSEFTGLLDKDGKEIWEGDLFLVANNHEYEIKYTEGHESNYEWYGGAFVMYLNDETSFPFDEYAMQNGVVTGNIHDK